MFINAVNSETAKEQNSVCPYYITKQTHPSFCTMLMTLITKTIFIITKTTTSFLNLACVGTRVLYTSFIKRTPALRFIQRWVPRRVTYFTRKHRTTAPCRLTGLTIRTAIFLSPRGETAYTAQGAT